MFEMKIFLFQMLITTALDNAVVTTFPYVQYISAEKNK